MLKLIKKYCSIFFLLLFLFPAAEKEFHAYKHIGESHCNERAAKHFHEAEHHCSICDFTSTDSNTPAKSQYTAVIAVSNSFYNPFAESVNTPNAFQNLPSRAPPIVLSA